MINGIVKIAASRWAQLFPERQIYIRSRGRVRYVALPPAAQFAGSAFVVMVSIWMTFASIDFISDNDTKLAARDAQIRELQASYSRLSAELAVVQQRLVTASLEREAKQGPAASAPLQNGAHAGVDVASGYEPVAPDVMAQKPVLPPRPRPEGFRAAADGAAGASPAIISIMPRERPRRSLELPSSMMATLNVIPGQPQAPDFSAGLSDASSAAARRQGDVISYLAADANTTIAALEKLISQTGLDADTILRRRDRDPASASHAAGGPLLKLPPAMTGKFMRRNLPGELALPPTRLGRLEMLREALFSLPLAEPVGKYYVSSGYGYRRDPFTKTRAFHSGMDLVAPHGDPVYASAPGTVIFAARNGEYGNMVEIDHGHGVKSRYGHLSRISVVRGQKIGLRDLIGRVGNTGRSGTAHLHFEVWFDGKARDPRNFLKAGENVFQRQG